MPALNLHYVDELITVRHSLHGGLPGAPRIQNGFREGASINRSCVVMLSALLQGYVEDVFKEALVRTFPAFATDAAAMEAYWKQASRWGNPNDGNIRSLFLRLGIADILFGLSWRNLNNASVRTKLNDMNQIRNKIAHGATSITVNGNTYSLSFDKVVAFRNFADMFGQRFHTHVKARIP